jgi:hypothetical protein
MGPAVPVRMLAALLFITGYYEFFNLAGAFNSSPWTAESFGGDPAKNASARRYVRKTVIRGVLVTGAGVVISGSWWPLIGTTLAAADTWWTYDQALAVAASTGSAGFQEPSGQGWKGLAW